MPRLEIHSGSRRKVFEILDDAFFAGRGEACGLRLAGRGVADRHAEFRWDGERLAVVAHDGEVMVNGREELGVDLEHGDVVELGPFRLVVWADGQPRPKVEPDRRAAAERPPAAGAGLDLRIDAAAVAGSRSAAAKRPRPAAAVPARPAGPPPRQRREQVQRRAGRWRGLLLVNLMLVVGAVGWLGYHVLAGVDLVREPGDSLALAEAQVDAGRFEQALATLRDARSRADDAAVRERIDAMRARIESLVQRRRDDDRIVAGRDDWNRIDRLAGRFVRDREVQPAAARWIVTEVDAWLDEFGEVFAAYPSTAPQLDAARSLRDRHAAAARLDAPPDADDVLFAAERPLDYRIRRYAQALEILESWLARRPDAPGADRVRERVAQLRAEGPQWLEQQLRLVSRMRERGEDDRASLTLDRLEAGLPADWLEPLRAMRGR